jgi:DNA-binding HxlR family transcriptional regulator
MEKKMQQRETATDRLADVIQVIRLGRKTGVLTVERGQGTTFEEGNIVFANGQIVQASVGSLNGKGALAWLSAWGNCMFTFIEQPVNNTPTPTTASTSYPFSLNTSSSQTEKQTHNNSPTMESSEQRVVSDPPRRTKSIEEGLALLEQRGFSRVYRRLLLLIDGRRSIVELGRLVGQSVEEVTRQLDELERAGFIQR